MDIYKYKFYYKEIELGLLEIKFSENLYKYTPIVENILPIRNSLVLPVDFCTPFDWGPGIPFFTTRVNNVRRFIDIPEEISYQTDNYSLKLIKE